MKQMTIANSANMQVSVCDFGARIVSIKVPFCRYNSQMLLVYPDLQSYLADPYYIGATIGRVANRIQNAQFELDGQSFNVSRNEGLHCLHGGTQSVDRRFWRLEKLAENEIHCHIQSADGDNGFPGEVSVCVVYRLTDDNQLHIEFSATTTRPTPISLTNHCYFNLGGTTLLDLVLSVSSRRYLLTDENNVATGQQAEFAPSLFGDAQGRALSAITRSLKEVASQDLDHCLLLPCGTQGIQLAARLDNPENGVRLEVHTDQPALQVYASGALAAPFQPHSAVCLEAQGVANGVNLGYPDNLITTPERPYSKHIRYAFSAI